MTSTGWQEFRLDLPRGPITGWRIGQGEPAILFAPSFGRSVTDFADLAERLAERGHGCILPETRGIAPAERGLDGLTQADLAGDLLDAMDGLGLDLAVLLGHAFGNRVVRHAAHLAPDRILAVALLAAGGAREIDPPIRKALEDCFRLDLPDADRLEAVRLAFFADGNDPAVWRDGWYPDVAAAQMRAADGAMGGEWMLAGGVPVLVVQPLEDKVAPPEMARALRLKLGARVSVVEIAGAGHALLPERPRETFEAIAAWLEGLA